MSEALLDFHLSTINEGVPPPTPEAEALSHRKPQIGAEETAYIMERGSVIGRIAAQESVETVSEERTYIRVQLPDSRPTYPPKPPVERRKAPLGTPKPLVNRRKNLAWLDQALCAQTDPDAFFPEKGGSTREAKRICVGCEVKEECLEAALSSDERFGISGGLSERERRRLKRVKT